MTDVQSSSRADIIMARCPNASKGRPNGNPRGRSTLSARGGATRSVTSRSRVIETVGIPAASMTLCISPTD